MTSVTSKKCTKKSTSNPRKKRKLCATKRPDSLRYTFYSILNTSLAMNRGSAAASIARSFLSLCFKLEESERKALMFDKWTHNGERILILKGYDHQHLKYLRDKVKYVAVDCHTLHQKWGNDELILVLTVFGREEDLEDVFDGLSFLR